MTMMDELEQMNRDNLKKDHEDLHLVDVMKWFPGAIAKAQRDMLMKIKEHPDYDEECPECRTYYSIQAMIDKLNKVIKEKTNLKAGKE